MRQAEEQGDLARAREHLQRLSALDPLSEDIRREWLRLCVLLHDHAGAQRVYAECEAMTQAEFGRRPQVATRAWLEQVRSTSDSGPQVGMGLPRLPLVGRSGAIRELQRGTTTTLLVGDPGVGKSRLALEFARQFPRNLLIAGAVAGAPLAAIAFTLDEAGEVAYSPPARQAVELLRGSQAGAEFSPARRDEFHAGLALALLEAVGGGGCLVLHDLHLFDPSSLDVLGRLLAYWAQLPAGRPAVVGTARAFELADSAAAEWVKAQRAAGLLRTIELSPLTGTDVLALVQHLSDGTGGTQFASALVEATGGNPLFFLETLRSLISAGHMHRDESGHWHVDFQASGGYTHLPLPGSVTEAVLSRAGLLPSLPRRVLDVLCLQTLPLSSSVLAQACQLSEWDVLEATRLLHSAGFLHEISGGYTLRHDLQRQALRGALSAQHLGVMHAVLAGSGASAQEVAQCFEAGNRDREAAQWWIRAAEQSRRTFANQEAVQAYERALKLGLTSRQEAETRVALFDLYSLLGRDEQVREQVPALHALLPEDPAMRGEYAVREALIHFRDAAYPAALQVTDQLLNTEQDAHLRGRAYHVRGMTHFRLGQFDQAQADLLEFRRLEPRDPTRRAVEVSRHLLQLAFSSISSRCNESLSRSKGSRWPPGRKVLLAPLA